ncbi:gamma-glutamyl-gamma-aminobutyrate hydrolase family protein [Scatolibacter rhodanostii]|uniref:gamma-glutamyl-gamma-aminobutyrate hydrolase family protein n=1 Tax=Scatolibacter rhodanostii TaxID=2014781 RepID=UPI000C077EEB|nr:gamma-glutamyl-gamma-aminobutyrate hydrolase family protein [Scatolibacter rhodanostii]
MKKIFVYGNDQTLKNYKLAIEQCGAVACFSTEIREANSCEALLLAGGGDMAPFFYQQKETACFNIDQKRDKDELELIQQFTKNERAIFGVCRGMQVINVAFGGDLLQDIKSPVLHAYQEKSGDQVHKITCREESFLSGLYGKEFAVNSAHHQGCQLPGDGLSYTAFAEDGICEALQDETKRIYAVQFHPERMSFGHKRNDTVDGRLIWEYFIRQI